MKPLLILVLLALTLCWGVARAGEKRISISDLHFVKTVKGHMRIEGLVKNLTNHPLRQVYVASTC